MSQAFERIIRHSVAMQRSLNALDSYRHAPHAAEQFARQAAALEQLQRPFRDMRRMIELMRPDTELARVMAEETAVTTSIAKALEPSIRLFQDSNRALDLMTAPMRLAFEQWAHQTEAVRRGIEALALQADFVGEFEVAEDGEGISEAPSAADSLVLPPPAQDRLVAVQYLPLRVLQAVADRPNLIYGLSSREFEQLIAELVAQFDFDNVTLTPRSHDGGRDVLATKRVNDIPLLFAFECKHYSAERKVGIESLRTLLGVVSYGPTQANVGVLVTSTFFTAGAREFILSEARIDGKDFDAIVKWLGEFQANRSLDGSFWAT